MNIVWFKRDLRLYDHQPLTEASKSNGDILCLHIIEPKLWQQPDLSGRQYDFYSESLAELKSEFESLNIPFCIRVGDAETIFNNLNREFNVKSILSHQETWNDWTYQRDKSLKSFFFLKNLIKINRHSFGMLCESLVLIKFA